MVDKHPGTTMTYSTSVQSCTEPFPIFEGSSWSTSILSSGIAHSSSLSNSTIYQSFHQGRCEATVAWVSKYGWGGLICPWLVSNFRHFNIHRWIIGVSFNSFGLGSSNKSLVRGPLHIWFTLFRKRLVPLLQSNSWRWEHSVILIEKWFHWIDFLYLIWWCWSKALATWVSIQIVSLGCLGNIRLVEHIQVF